MKNKRGASGRRERTVVVSRKMAAVRPPSLLLCAVAAAAALTASLGTAASDVDPLSSEVDLGDRPMMFVDYLNGPLRGRKGEKRWRGRFD